MNFYKEITLKNGKPCILRNAVASDTKEFIDYFLLAHSETDFLTTYPEESKLTLEEEEKFLDAMAESDREIELVAIVDGKLVASASNSIVRDRIKMRHRADFGISVIKEYWGLGIGHALTERCIEKAKEAGFTQLELEAVGENEGALSLYKKLGFVEFGRNPRGFLKKDGTYQELVSMRLELE
ncbi:MAG: GNAT family N-acetyltransferase [Dorea sp.]|nr:GNAT family N-acetyltransferase [Dorea sp.]